MPKNSTVGDGSIVSKRRKLLDVQKTLVITVRAEDQRGDQGPPSDSWSWRKYGQKPIKGSPHPRGYYKCSSCKGCTARKQVERSSADASQLIVTYISDHNHPAPATTSTNPTPQEQSSDTVIAGQSGRAANNAVPRHAEGAAASSEPYGGEGEKESCDFFDELEELPSLACMVQQQLL